MYERCSRTTHAQMALSGGNRPCQSGISNLMAELIGPPIMIKVVDESSTDGGGNDAVLLVRG